MKQLVFRVSAGELPTESGDYICSYSNSKYPTLYYDAELNTWHDQRPYFVDGVKTYMGTYIAPYACVTTSFANLLTLQKQFNRLAKERDDAHADAKAHGLQEGLKSSIVIRAVAQIDVPTKEEVTMLTALFDKIYDRCFDLDYPRFKQGDNEAEFDERRNDWYYQAFVKQWNERKAL